METLRCLDSRIYHLGPSSLRATNECMEHWYFPAVTTLKNGDRRIDGSWFLLEPEEKIRVENVGWELGRYHESHVF